MCSRSVLLQVIYCFVVSAKAVAALNVPAPASATPSTKAVAAIDFDFFEMCVRFIFHMIFQLCYMLVDASKFFQYMYTILHVSLHQNM